LALFSDCETAQCFCSLIISSNKELRFVHSGEIPRKNGFANDSSITCFGLFKQKPGSAITNGREPRSCLGQVFNSKLGCFATLGRKSIV
jgi:hypothetical protein